MRYVQSGTYGIVDYTNYDDMKYAVSLWKGALNLLELSSTAPNFFTLFPYFV